MALNWSRADLDELTDDEDFKDFALFVMSRERRVRTRGPDHFKVWRESEFLDRFRVSKNAVRFLVHDLRNAISSCINRVSAEQKVLLTLRYYATGSLRQATSDFSGIGNATGCRIIRLVSHHLALIRPGCIDIAEDEEEIAEDRVNFYKIARFPRCIGAIDGTLVKIKAPQGNDAERYRTRDGFFAMRVMAVCDAELKFVNIVARWPGIANDSTVFQHSALRQKFESNLLGDSVLVGGPAYAPTNYLLTPLREPVTEGEILYNESLMRTRACIDQTIEAWKRRFPILATGINGKIMSAQCIIVATAVLHNIARYLGDPVPRVTRVVQQKINITNVNSDPIPHNIDRPLRQIEMIDYFGSM